MNRISRWLAAAAAAFALTGVLVCEAAFANTAQYCGMRTDTGMTGIRGARVNVERYNPRVTYLVSAAWTLVDRSDLGGAFAQVGYCEIQGWGDHPYYFYEYSDAAGNDPGAILLDAVPNGGNYTGTDDLFTVQFVAGGEIKYRINGVVQATTDRDWTPDNAQFCGEIITNGVTYPQMPGDSNHKVDFETPAFFSDNDDLWHNLSPWGSNTTMTDSATYGNWQRCGTDDDPKFFKIWDTRYSTLP